MRSVPFYYHPSSRHYLFQLVTMLHNQSKGRQLDLTRAERLGLLMKPPGAFWVNGSYLHLYPLVSGIEPFHPIGQHMYSGSKWTKEPLSHLTVLQCLAPDSREIHLHLRTTEHPNNFETYIFPLTP